MSSSLEAKIALIPPVPRQPDVKIEDRTVLELELMLKRAKSILSNGLLVARLEDQGAKLSVKVTQIEAELTKRSSNTAPDTPKKTKSKVIKTNQPKKKNIINHDEDASTTECGEHNNSSQSKLRGRYDECLVPAANLYSSLKHLSIEESIVHIKKEAEKEMSRTNAGCPVDVSNKQSRIMFTNNSSR